MRLPSMPLSTSFQAKNRSFAVARDDMRVSVRLPQSVTLACFAFDNSDGEKV